VWFNFVFGSGTSTKRRWSDLINKKRAGQPITKKERPAAGNVVDLMDALRRSVGGAEPAKLSKPSKKPCKAASEIPMSIEGKKPAKKRLRRRRPRSRSAGRPSNSAGSGADLLPNAAKGRRHGNIDVSSPAIVFSFNKNSPLSLTLSARAQLVLALIAGTTRPGNAVVPLGIFPGLLIGGSSIRSARDTTVAMRLLNQGSGGADSRGAPGRNWSSSMAKWRLFVQDFHLIKIPSTM
jgi:hypothetical protein